MSHDVIHAIVHASGDAFTAECMEFAVVTQGRTLDELTVNLNDAVALHLEGEDLAALGLANPPLVQLMFAAEPGCKD
jgi:predicted RNase H-like HicB family nuclease